MPFYILLWFFWVAHFSLGPLSAGPTWKLLSSSDKIDIVWPSGAPEPFFSPKTLDAAVKKYGLAGVNAHMDQIDASASFLGYYANTDEKRAVYLYQVLSSSATKAVWSGRGGFGAVEALSILDVLKYPMPDQIVPVIGFSDCTGLHLWFHRHKRPTLHGILAAYSQEMNPLGVNGKTSMEPVMKMLRGEISEVSYTLKVLNPNYYPPIACQPTTTVLGGNLSVVERAQGTPIALNPPMGSVIFLEDTPEAAVRSKSLLTNLAFSGLFDHARALFLGDLPLTAVSLEALAGEFDKTLSRRGYRIPILHATGFGHGALNQVIPLGTKASLQYTQGGEAILTINVRESAYDY